MPPVYDINGNALTDEKAYSGAGEINEISSLYNSVGFVSDSNGRDIPLFTGVRNAYKRAHQFLDIKFTPLAPIPTNSSSTGLSAGTEYTGMMYSEALQYEKYIGFGVSIRSVMTALHNPYSVMYTEDINSSRARTAYGFTYLFNQACGSFFGSVCSALTGYAIGSDVNWQSGDLAWLAEQGIFERIYDQSASGARLMDIIWTNGHVRIITDIYRDGDGNPTSFAISESVSNVAVTNSRSPAWLNTQIANGAVLYRYRNLYKNTEYEQSSFVAVDGETPQTYTYNGDICTYLGDYVSIADWEKMFINYTKGSYTQMQLYKGNSLIQTISLPSSYNATHSIDVTSYLTGAGEYKARLTDGTNHSDYCYFEVVGTNVSTALNSGKLTVNFSSANATPLFVKLKNANGHVNCTYVFSDEELHKGTCTFDANALRIAQGRSMWTSAVYARVFFQGKYNQVMGGYVDSHIYQ